jgi:hypothetical protein
MEILQTPVHDRSAWMVANLEEDRSWDRVLTAGAITELDAAIAGVKRRRTPLLEITRADFPLPTLGKQLETIPEELEEGVGFVVLRGVPVDRYMMDEARIAIWGMGTYMGMAISQNARGEQLCSVTDQGREYGARGRGYQTNDRLDFHCDNSDVVALLFLRKAKEGGLSLLTSATSIYNEIVEKHCEQLPRLYRGYHYDLRGEGRSGVGTHSGHRVPVYSYLGGKLSCRYVRNGIELGAESSGNPLTTEDIALLDLIDEIARRPEYCFVTDFNPGDMQIVNNHTTLHARTDYVDYPEPGCQRHALRLWLNLAKGRPLAYEFSNRYGPNSGRLGVPPVERPPEHIAPS